MVEQWSPKPPVASSNLVSPANIDKPKGTVSALRQSLIY